MDRLKGVTEARRAALATATKRAAEAESLAKEKGLLLQKKTDEASELQKRVELTRQSNALKKDLLAALQKLDETKKKLATATEKADRLGSKVQALHDEADTYESKYQTSKKDYNQLIAEMDHLGIN
ncbi:hypothetical protein HYPSUDRAFT_34483 [Hypholoma sublateritium FD-334 SS-4]|uniref:Tropomyosin n=1 Tax=Hypholoma sublateritium (strain FD-334 SS-4) TaxID=945553 RepID=A0A0D2PB80_HYPSF|nr:hypothetical protein HYPSUDRAFT_34483 [Hypholoma sublateritium FD-334 SS-4]